MTLQRLPVYPYGIKVSLTWLQIATHLDDIERYGIVLFIELGVLEGGLTSVLLPGVKAGLFNYFGVELNKEYVNPRIDQEASIIYGDCFDDMIKSQIKEIIHNTSGPMLLFCDNGNKPKEVLEYSPLLRSGDFISVHDYGTEVQPIDLEVLDGLFVEIDSSNRREYIKMPLFKKL